jgi:hypothetical protein
MELYIAQKADEALEAMCGRESLTKRLEKARMCFGFVADDYFLATAPVDVRESITALMKSKGGRGCSKSAALVQSAIYSAFVEFGRQDALLSLSLKQKDDARPAYAAGAWIEMQPALPAPQVPKDGPPDSVPVEPPTPAPTAPPTPRPAP